MMLTQKFCSLNPISILNMHTNNTQKPPSTYHIEYAKSSRSQCKKCKEKIAKDVLRIVTSELIYNIFCIVFGMIYIVCVSHVLN